MITAENLEEMQGLLKHFNAHIVNYNSESFTIQDVITGTTLNYTFYNSYASDIINMLLKATEDKRFKEFSTVMDKQIVEELSKED